MTFFKTAALIALTSCASPVVSQENNCAPTEQVAASLAQQEYQVSFIGAVDNGAELIIFTGPKGWIAAVDTHKGVMCLAGVGNDWQLKTGNPA